MEENKDNIPQDEPMVEEQSERKEVDLTYKFDKGLIRILIILGLILFCCAGYIGYLYYQKQRRIETVVAEQEPVKIDSKYNAEVPSATTGSLPNKKIETYEQEENRKKTEQEKSEREKAEAEKNKDLVQLQKRNSDLRSLSGQSDQAKVKPSSDPYYDYDADPTVGFNTQKELSTYEQYQKLQSEQQNDVLQARIEELEAKLQEKEAEVKESNDVAKQIELAMRQSSAMMQQQPVVDRDTSTVVVKRAKLTEVKMMPLNKQVVSSLSQDSEVIGTNSFSRSINSSREREGEKNTLKVVVDKSVTVKNGEFVNLRLIERSRIGNTILPANTVVVARGNIQGNRMKLVVSSIEYKDKIFSTNLTAFDLDGQEGVFIPGSDELNAVQEIGANMVGTVAEGGSNFTVNQQSAKDQIAVEGTKGLMRGISRLLQKKIQQVKIHLKSNHKLYLVAMEDIREAKNK